MAQEVLRTLPVYHDERTLPRLAVAHWGYFPVICLTSALALALIALADVGGRGSEPWGQTVFWIGALLLFVPVALRVLSASTPRHERIALVVLIALGMYLIKVFQSPASFTYHDEFIHWQTLDDILRSGHLFHENSQIPVSSLYPGLHIVTDALIDVSGLDVFAAGVIVLGAARVLLILSLFLLYEQISRSARIAGIAALLYTGNSNFTFFMSQFAYESLALPLAAFVLYAIAMRGRGEQRVEGANLAVIVAVFATSVTHHLTSYALIAFLAAWPLICFFWRAGEPFVRAFFRGSLLLRLPGLRALPGWLMSVRTAIFAKGLGFGQTAFLALVISVVWMVYVATPTVGYLEPVFREGIKDLLRMISGEAAGRQLFQSTSGQAAPLWEQITTYAAIGLIVLGLPLGLWQLGRRFRDKPYAFVLALGALAYPVTLAFRLTQHGWEISNRASEFLFVGLTFVLALGITRAWRSGVAHRVWIGICAVCVTVIFMGGLIAGWPSWSRLPGPYLVAADSRSVEPQGITTAVWAQEYLGSDNRMGADRTNGLLLGSYGNQRMVTGVFDKVFLGQVFFSTQFTAQERFLLQQGRVSYLVVDQRLSTGLPMFGVYLENGEPDAGQHKTPISPLALGKFDFIPGVSRLYDSGDIAIYDVREVSYAP